MSVDRREVVLVSGVRTAVGEFLGTLAPLTAPQLGAKVIEETVRRAGSQRGCCAEAAQGG